MGLWGVIFDEYSQQPSNIFTEIIRPALADHKGYAIWIGTPKGKNDFYRLYEQSKNDDKWLGILLDVHKTGLIDDEELADSKKIMTDDEYNQEWFCSFEAAIKGAYYAEELSKARKDGRITKVDYDSSLPVYTIWDLGISDAMAIIFVQKYNQEVRMIDYYENSGKGLDHYAKILEKKPYVYARHIAPHDIQVRELTTGKTRKQIAVNYGIDFYVQPKFPISDGINAGRLMFPRLWIDEVKCLKWLDYIAQYCKEWDDSKGMFKDTPLHNFTSHAADAYRYTALAENLMNDDKGACLTEDTLTDARHGVIITDGFVSEDDMLFEKEPNDFRYN